MREKGKKTVAKTEGRKKQQKDQQYLSKRKIILLRKSGRICRDCLRRQGVPLNEAKQTGVKATECEVCEGSIARLPGIAKSIASILDAYEFQTFLVGTSLPQRLLDREDEIRSRLKIRGVEGIKTQITRTIGRRLVQRTGKKVDYSRPDITLLVSVPDGTLSITPRSIWLSARYNKTVRGFSQRSSLCNICNGVGCASCNYRGSTQSSIQSRITEYLTGLFEAEGCNFIWVGSEDENSLVGGSGRPFYVEIQKPKKRKFKQSFLSSGINLDGLVIFSINPLVSRPTSIPQFSIKCAVYLLKTEGGPEELRIPPANTLKEEVESKFRETIVRVRLSKRSRLVNRQIHSILVKEGADGRHPFIFEIECDGGIPIRKLFSGTEDAVMPNLAPCLGGLTIDPEMPFDIEDVKLHEPIYQSSSKQYTRTRNNTMEKRTFSAEQLAHDDGSELIAEEQT